jgi:hypothetical protein
MKEAIGKGKKEMTRKSRRKRSRRGRIFFRVRYRDTQQTLKGGDGCGVFQARHSKKGHRPLASLSRDKCTPLQVQFSYIVQLLVLAREIYSRAWTPLINACNFI